jgi:predicted MFS family arabinose efflux permease
VKLLVLALGAFAIGTDLFVIAGILPGVAGDLDTSIPAAGQLVTVFAIAYAVLSPALTVALGRVERRRLLVAALGLFTAANVITAAAPVFPVALMARVAAAAGAGLFTPTATVMAAGMVREELRGRALATITAGLSTAQVVGVPIGIAVGNVASWRATFALISVLGAAAALGVAGFLPRIPAPSTAGLRSRLGVARRPGMMPVLALTSFGLAAGFITFTYLAPVVRHTFGLGPLALSPLTFLFGLLGVGGNLLGGWLADRAGGDRAALVSLLGTVLGLGLFAAAATLAGWVARWEVWSVALTGFVVWGVFGWGLVPAQQHRLLTLAPDAAQVAIALNSVAIYAGITLAGAMGGVAEALSGPAAVTWTATAVALGSLLLGLLTARLRDPQLVARRAGAPVPPADGRAG